MGTSNLLSIVATVLISGLASSPALGQASQLDASASDSWKLSPTAYWSTSSIGNRQSLDGTSVGLDGRFLDVLPDFGFGKELRAEVRDGDWTFELHRTYPTLAAAGRVGADTTKRVIQPRLVEALVSYRVDWPIRAFEILGGGR